jgi:cytochrome c-type biogenesis protein CcmH/NrfG
MRKSFIIGLVVLFVLVLAGGGFFWYQKNQHQPPGQSLPNKDRNLTQDQQKFYQDRIAKAESYLSSLNPSQPNFKQEQASTYIYLGQQYFGLGQMQKSKDAYNLALRADPKQAQALVGLAVTLLDAGDTGGAQQALEQALGYDKSNPDIWLRYIDLRQNLGASVKDINEIYQQALASTGRYIDVLTRYANFESQNGQIQQAIALWQEAAKQYPNNSAFTDEIKRLQNSGK